MGAVITTLHIIVCIFLVAVVLLQRGKGAQVGAVFGGGAGATMFGGRGAGNFLTKLTSGAAAVFMITSLSLSYLGISGAGQRLFDEGEIPGTESEAPLFEELGTVPAPAEGATPLPAPGAEASPPATAAPEAASGDAPPDGIEAAPAEPPTAPPAG